VNLRRRGEPRLRHKGANDAAAIESRLVELRRALEMHSRALQQLMETSADAINLRLYRQCIGEIRGAIAVEDARLQQAQQHGVPSSEKCKSLAG
jgi:hypothetical protein